MASQVILEFQRFGELYKRPAIAKALQADREILLGFIDAAEKAVRHSCFLTIGLLIQSVL